MRFLLFASITTILCGCVLDDTLGPEHRESRSYRQAVPLSGGLIQTVEIEPFEPAFGDTVRIKSTISNPTRTTRMVSAEGCGVLLRSSAHFKPVGAQACFFGSLDFTVKPGQSLSAEAFRVLNDTTTGLHVIGIQHATSPDFVMLIDVLVVDRD